MRTTACFLIVLALIAGYAWGWSSKMDLVFEDGLRACVEAR